MGQILGQIATVVNKSWVKINRFSLLSYYYFASSKSYGPSTQIFVIIFLLV